jgi:PAS domain S-box-containing protein
MPKLKNSKESASLINFEDLFNSSYDAILVIDPQNEIILEANQCALELFGYSNDQFIDKKLLDISKNIELERQRIFETLSENSSQRFETLRYTSTKKEIYLDVNISLIKYKDDNAIIQLCRDITKRKHFELALEESENKYRALYQNLPLILITVDIKKNILSINENGANSLGYNVDELLGSDLSELFAPKESTRLEQQIKNVFHNSGKVSSHEMKMLRKNKREFWVRETIYSTLDPDNKTQVFLVCDNITWQKNAEANAKDLALSLQSMLDASPLGVLVYRLDENDELILISTNQSAVDILQIDVYALISKKIQEIFPGLVGEGLIEKYRAVISTGHPLRNQTISYKDEHFRGIYEYSALKLTPNTIAVFFTDITEKQKAITALSESEIKYKTLFESANDAIFLMKDETFIDCNLKTTEIFGRTKEDIIGSTPQSISPEYQSDGRLSIESAKEKINLALNNYPQFFEWEHNKPDGSIFNVEVNLKKIEFHNEVYLQAIVRDITGRKVSEKIISDQRRELATLMSNLPGMAYRCANNINWTMQFVSEGCYDLTGYKPEELINDKIISYANIIYKEDRLNVNEDVQEAVLNKEPFTLLYRIVTSSEEEKWVWEKGRGVYDSSGNLICLEGFITDITERKRSEEKIKILAHALTSVTECVCITDLRDRIKFINTSFSRVYGYNLQELMDKHISIIRSDKNDPEIVRRILPETLAGGWTGELINIRKDGEEFPIYLSTSSILNEEGRPIAMTGIIVEVTDRIRLERELADLRRELAKLKQNDT